MNIHKNIKKLREEKGLTLEEVGKKIGTTKQTIGRYESGEISNIPYDRIIQLAECFEVHPGKIMGFEDYPKDTPSFKKEHFLLINLYEELNNENKKTILNMMKFYVDSQKRNGDE